MNREKGILSRTAFPSLVDAIEKGFFDLRGHELADVAIQRGDLPN